MKKCIGAVLALTLLCSLVSAQGSVGDSFDFESYSPGSSLKSLPEKGSYGAWSLNNCTNDGVTAEKTGKGTSLVLVHEKDQYPGVRYVFGSGNCAAEGIHVKYSFKISGGDGETIHFFRFRKKGSSVPYNIMKWEDSNLITVMGQKLKNGFNTLYGVPNEWYDVDIKYNVTSCFAKICITWRSMEFDFTGFAPFEGLDNVEQVLFEESGKISSGVCKTYIDDVLIEHTPALYKENETVSFENYYESKDGTLPPEGFTGSGIYGFYDAEHKFSGMFTERNLNGKMLSVCENFNSGTEVCKKFSVSAENFILFETDIGFPDLNSDKCVFLNDKKILEFKALSGNLVFGGASTGFTPRTDLIYNLKIFADTKSGEYTLSVSCGGEEFTRAHIKDKPFEKLESVKFKLENYEAFYGDTAKMLLNNISLKEVSEEEFNKMKGTTSFIEFYSEKEGSFEKTEVLKSGKIKVVTHIEK